MSKAHRGKGIRDQVSHGRGTCPVCERYNVKILYEMEAGEQKFKICKTCKAAIKNGKKKLPVADTPKPEPVAEEKPVAATEVAAAPAVEEKPAEAATEAPVPQAPAAEDSTTAAE